MPNSCNLRESLECTSVRFKNILSRESREDIHRYLRILTRQPTALVPANAVFIKATESDEIYKTNDFARLKGRPGNFAGQDVSKKTNGRDCRIEDIPALTPPTLLSRGEQLCCSLFSRTINLVRFVVLHTDVHPFLLRWR